MEVAGTENWRRNSAAMRPISPRCCPVEPPYWELREGPEGGVTYGRSGGGGEEISDERAAVEGLAGLAEWALIDELGLDIGFSVGRCEERLVKEDFILMVAGGKGFEISGRLR